MLQIEAKEIRFVELIDNNGSTIYLSGYNKDKVTICMKTFKSGIYMLKLTTLKGHVVKRLVIW